MRTDTLTRSTDRRDAPCASTDCETFCSPSPGRGEPATQSLCLHRSRTTSHLVAAALGRSMADNGLSRKQKKKMKERAKKAAAKAGSVEGDASGENGGGTAHADDIPPPVSPATADAADTGGGGESSGGGDSGSRSGGESGGGSGGGGAPVPPHPPSSGAEVATAAAAAAAAAEEEAARQMAKQITYVDYTSETQLPAMMEMIDQMLSEPYSIFTYRYFLNAWPNLCICAMLGGETVGVIICKVDARLKSSTTTRHEISCIGRRMPPKFPLLLRQPCPLPPPRTRSRSFTHTPSPPRTFDTRPKKSQRCRATRCIAAISPCWP